MTLISYILLLTRVVIAVQLTRVALRQKMPNLMWLAGFFYATAMGDVAFAFFNFYPVFALGIGLGEIAMVMFIQKTFYQGRKSPFLPFMAVAIFFALANVYNVFTNPFFYPYFSPFNWGWLIVVAMQAYKQIAADQSVEDWVKARYKLIVAYSVCALAGTIQSVVVIIATVMGMGGAIFMNPLFNAFNYVVFGATTACVVIEYLAWIMPGSYMRWLNRKYQALATGAADLEMSEEELLRQLQPN